MVKFYKNKLNIFKIAILILCLNTINAKGQFNMVGATTSVGSNCFVLTTTTWQNGAVWDIHEVNLSNSFDVTLTLNFGNITNENEYLPPCGADGISFIFQQVSSGVGSVGQGIGFEGIFPSLGVIMDDYQNTSNGDPTFDHMSMSKNGDVNHGSSNELVPYSIPLSAGFPQEIETGLDYSFRLKWDATTTTLKVWFNGTLMISYSDNIVSNIFLGNPNVYWGIGSSTGVCENVQTVCINISADFNAPSCSGLSVNFTNTSISSTPITSYLWDFGDGQTSTAENPTHVYNSLGTYTVQLTITNSGGLTSTISQTITNGVNLTVGPPLMLNCNITSGTISASSTNTGATYNWSGPGIVSGDTTSTPLVNTAGTYTVTVTNDQGCTAKDTVIVTLNPLPTANAGPDVPICNGSSTTLDASASAGTGPLTYNWSGGLGSGPSHTVTPLSTITYILTVTDIYGCIGTDNVTITVNPTPSFSYVANDANCNGSGGSITLTPSIGSPPYSYIWNPSVSTTAVAANLTAGTYYVTMTDNNGCTVTSTILIENDPRPIVTASSQNEICEQANGSAEVTASEGNAPYTYLWSNSSTDSIATSLTAGNYTVTVTDNNGCSNSTSVNIQETPGPDADFSAHPNVLTIMEGPVSFVDNSSGTIVNWQWNFGDGSSNGNGIEINHDYENIGTFLATLIVTDNNGCTDTTTDTIIVKDIFTVYIPNAFTPDDDGIDDYFFPQGVNWDPDHFEMYIFDRWGNLIYQTKTIGEKWNGSVNNNGTQDDMLIGVYVYLIRIKELEGPKHQYIGRVTLAR